MPPEPYRPYVSPRPRPPRRWAWWPVVLFAAAGLCFVFSCSGLAIPMRDPASTLNGHLSAATGKRLPASADVPCGVRVAMRDATEFYKVRMPPADVVAFFATFPPAGDDPAAPPAVRFYTGVQPPDWWVPQSLPNVRVQSSDTATSWYYSETSGTVHVVRMEF